MSALKSPGKGGFGADRLWGRLRQAAASQLMGSKERLCGKTGEGGAYKQRAFLLSSGEVGEEKGL